MILDQRPETRLRCVFGFRILEALGFSKATTQPEDNNSKQCADEERNTPAPGFKGRSFHCALKHDQQQNCQKLTGDQRHILEG